MTLATSQFVILSRRESTDDGLAPIGTAEEIVARLADFNTGPERAGGEILFGPGIRIELPPNEDPVRQMLMTVEEEEIAWMVIMRIAKFLEWRILDPTTGRELNP